MTAHPDDLLSLALSSALCVAGVLLWLAVEAGRINEWIRKR